MALCKSALKSPSWGLLLAAASALIVGCGESSSVNLTSVPSETSDVVSLQSTNPLSCSNVAPRIARLGDTVSIYGGGLESVIAVRVGLGAPITDFVQQTDTFIVFEIDDDIVGTLFGQVNVVSETQSVGCPGFAFFRGVPRPLPDADGDGVLDFVDNCPNDANADQLDSDMDGIGDVCDPTPFPTLFELDQTVNQPAGSFAISVQQPIGSVTTQSFMIGTATFVNLGIELFTGFTTFASDVNSGLTIIEFDELEIGDDVTNDNCLIVHELGLDPLVPANQIALSTACLP